ncbi:MAG: FkbM family methyltransferase [Terrimicrobiaceae bacterium]
MNRANILYSVFEQPCDIWAYGEGNGAWNIAAKSLSQESTVFSVGVGNDISFDMAVHKAHGCRIVLIDPTPTGERTILFHSPLPASMIFLPVGLSHMDGNISFSEPSHRDEGSFRLKGGDRKIEFPCRRLSTLLKQHGVDVLDLLKMDIEGFEYTAIKDLIRSRCNVRQICVEFHHGIVPGISRWHTLGAIIRLRLAGYTLVNHVGLNHTFIKKSA